MENNGGGDKKESQTIIINQKTGNSMGVAGLVLAILSWFLICLPILSSILWLLGSIFSIIGLFKRPRGAAIAGVIISFIGLIIIIFVVLGLTGLGVFSEFLPEDLVP